MKTNSKTVPIKLFSALDRLCQPNVINDFPKVTVDQTNFRIGDIIKRNLAGEQVMGDTHMSYDYENSSDDPNFDKVNPFSDMGFNLDDVITLAHQTSQQVTDLQNRQGELKASLDKAKKEQEEVTKVTPEPAAPAPSGGA